MTKHATFDFTGAVVLIVGARTGIGQAIARAFCAAGAHVVLSSRNGPGLQTLADTLGTERAVVIPVDLTQRQSVDALVSGVVERFGRLDVVVNCGVHFFMHTLEDLDDRRWEAMRAVNLDGLVYLARAALPHLEAVGGNFIAFSSIAGLRGDWGWPAYNATKAAVANFVRSLSLEWGRRGVRVNSIAPGVVEVEWNTPLFEAAAVRAGVENRTAVGRLAQPAEIAPTVLFLASDAASYITGAVLPVDGGTSASSGQPHFEVPQT